MLVSVSAQVRMDQFRSEWDDPETAARDFSQFVQAAWKEDLLPLAVMGVKIEVEVNPAHPSREWKPAAEIKVEPYQSDVFDMMAQTRKMLTDQKELFERFSRSKAANALYR